MAALFFAEMRFDPQDPRNPGAIASCCRRATPRRFCTRRGPRPAPSIAAELLKLRRIDSDLEGHPTPRLPFVGRRDRLARPGHLRRDRHAR